MQPLDVPQTDGGIIRATDEVAIHEGAPSKAVALCLVPYQPEVRVAVIVCWLGGVLAVVKDIHLCTDGFGGNEEGVLRHVPRPVDLTLMVYLLNHLNLACSTEQGPST